jgi:hypothetical protein
MAEVNSFSNDSKIASLDLFPIIKWGARTAARLIPDTSQFLFHTLGKHTLP